MGRKKEEQLEIESERKKKRKELSKNWLQLNKNL